jgi:nucleoside-diphosphate-sugar epimerase
VTGSAGFIGRSLTNGLRTAGHEVIGVDLRSDGDRSDRFYLIDILDKSSLKECFLRERPERVVHLAARIDIDKKAAVSDYPANIAGVRNMVEAIRDTPSVRRAIFFSSKTVHYDGYVPKHDTDFAPVSTYGESKALGEKIVRENDGGGVVWCIVRPPTVWGPGVSAHYQRFFRMIQKGRYFHVGSRPRTKSYAYIGNLVYQCLRLLEAPTESVHRRVFYLGEYEDLDLRRWTEEFRKAFQAPPIRNVPEVLARMAARLGDVINWIGFRSFPFNTFRLNNVLNESQLDHSRTRDVCGPLPYTLEAAVRETVEWMKQEALS